jgi:hypothetical protein
MGSGKKGKSKGQGSNGKLRAAGPLQFVSSGSTADVETTVEAAVRIEKRSEAESVFSACACCICIFGWLYL